MEQVVMQLQGQGAVGIASFIGDHATLFQARLPQVAPALNNYTAIKSAYDGWGPPRTGGRPHADVRRHSDGRGDAAGGPNQGPKYIMLVTDGETDFCDDGNALCPADAITYLVQDLYNQTPSIGTLVVGIPDTARPIRSSRRFSRPGQRGGRAGGRDPNRLGRLDPMDFWYQCNGSMTTGMDWQNLFTAAGRTGMTSLASYTTVGTAAAFTPTDTSTSALVSQISTAINTIPPSCVFDLSSLAKPIKVDRTKLNEGGVFLNGVPVPSTRTTGRAGI